MQAIKHINPFKTDNLTNFAVDIRTLRRRAPARNVKVKNKMNTTCFSEESVAQWARRSKEKLVHFTSTGELPAAVFDFE